MCDPYARVDMTELLDLELEEGGSILVEIEQQRVGR